MNSWCYGLVREKGKLRVCELYWFGKNKKPSGYSYVFKGNRTLRHWGWVIRDIPLIIKDLKDQIKYHRVFDEKEFK